MSGACQISNSTVFSANVFGTKILYYLCSDITAWVIIFKLG